MRDTQLEAWDTLQATLSEKRLRVLQEIRKHPKGIALFQLSKDLGWTINRISGRVTELCAMGMVMDTGIRVVNPATNKQCIAWVYHPTASGMYQKQRSKNQLINELKKQVKVLTMELSALRRRCGIKEEKPKAQDPRQMDFFG
jgi:predicted transcriptional regulator